VCGMGEAEVGFVDRKIRGLMRMRRMRNQAEDADVVD